jgi:hypothetical protein
MRNCAVVLVFVWMVFCAAYSQGQQTKTCRLLLQHAPAQASAIEVLIKDLDNYTIKSRPAVEKALTAWINDERLLLSDTCATADVNESIAAFKRDSAQSTLDLVYYADVRQKAERKEAK